MSESAGLGGHVGDFIHYLHAFGDLAENRITPAAHVFASVIQKRVVDSVDKELVGGGVGLAGTRHGDGSAFVLQAVIGFVLYRRLGGAFVVILVKAAALIHKTLDHAMEDSAIVSAVINVCQKVFHGVGRLVGKQFNFDIALRGFHQYFRVIRQRRCLRGRQHDEKGE